MSKYGSGKLPNPYDEIKRLRIELAELCNWPFSGALDGLLA